MIKYFIISLLFFSVILSSKNLMLLNLMNEKSDWIYDYTDNDINVYILKNDSLPIIRLETEIYNPVKLFKTILDIRNYNNILTERTVTSKFIAERSDTLFCYQITKNLIPFTRNRQLIFKMYEIDDNRIEWYLVNENHDYLKPFKRRRTKDLVYGGGAWEITKLSDNRYKLIHYFYIDPNINIPKFLTDSPTKKSVVQVFKDVLNNTRE
tara:strand:+ start:596 stop:1222 length:627 start_codon:yes stop_codon:yes gene_type:complete